MSARFVVHGAFDLTRRGTVLLGDVIAGVVHPGMHLQIPGREPASVSSVEVADSPGKRESHLGLVLGPTLSAAGLLEHFPPGTELTLVDAPSPGAAAPMSRAKRLQYLLEEVCVSYGICSAARHTLQLESLMERGIDAVATELFKLEGLDPSDERDLYDEVRASVARHYAEWFSAGAA